MTVDRELIGDTWEDSKGCTTVGFDGEDGIWSIGPVEPGAQEYEVEMHGGGSATSVHVGISSSGMLVAERDYDFAFLSSGDVDRIDVVTESGRIHQFNAWGGPECDYSRLSDSPP